LFSAAFIILIAFCGYFYYALAHINGTLLHEKILDRRFTVDLACDEVDRLVAFRGDWDTFVYTEILSEVAARIDATGGTYCQLFDGNLMSLSDRTPLFDGAPFDPWEFPAFLQAVSENERGEATVWFEKEGAVPHRLHLYFRWIPTDETLQNRLLMIVGVSKFSVNTGISSGVTYGAAALIAVSAVFIVGSVVLLSYVLGMHVRKRENAHAEE